MRESSVTKRKVHILLVDDDDNDTLFLQRAVEKTQGRLEVHCLHHGEDAVKYLEGAGEFTDRHRYPLPQIILLDLKMPAVTGFDVLRLVKSNPEWRHLVVIIFSSSTDPKDVLRAYDLGANSYVSKSDFSRLTEMVASMEGFWCGINIFPDFSADPQAGAPAFESPHK